MKSAARVGVALGLLVLALGCSGPTASAESEAPAPHSGPQDPPPPTAETLQGTVDLRKNENIAWVRTLPGGGAAPEIQRGPGDELVVLASAERRPVGKTRYLSDLLLLRLDAESGALRWLQVVDAGAHFTLDTRGNVILAWPERLEKRDPDGNVLWSQKRTQNGYERVQVVADHDDNLLIARLELDQDPGMIGAEPKGFVELEKLDASGNRVWSSRFGDSTTYLEAVWLTTDAANNPVLLAAGLNGAFDFGGGAVEGEDVVAKYDAEGKHLFSKAFGGYGPTRYQASSPIVTDLDGNIFVWTDSVGDIDIGLGSFFCARQYVIKLDPAGSALWQTCTNAQGLAATANGDLLVTSRLPFTLDGGDQQCATGGNKLSELEGSLTRYDADGIRRGAPCMVENLEAAREVQGSGMFFMTAYFAEALTLPDGIPVQGLSGGTTALIAKVRFPAP